MKKLALSTSAAALAVASMSAAAWWNVPTCMTEEQKQAVAEQQAAQQEAFAAQQKAMAEQYATAMQQMADDQRRAAEQWSQQWSQQPGAAKMTDHAAWIWKNQNMRDWNDAPHRSRRRR